MPDDTRREPTPPPINATLFGKTRLSVGDRDLPPSVWPRRSARMLLLLLLATPGHSLPRDMVLDRLWPEADAETAQNRFHIAVHSLRRVLEPDLKTRESSAYLSLTASTVAIPSSPGAVVDVDRFESLIAQARSTNGSATDQLLGEALDLYRGDLLADEAYVDWPVVRRESLRITHRKVLLDQCASSRESGQPLRYLESLQALLQTEPADEEVHRSLIAGLIAGGRLDAARKQFELCRAALHEQFELEPSAETRALFEKLSVPAATPPSEQAIIEHRFRPVPVSLTELIGRSDEVAEIESLFRVETTRLVTLTGPPGVGKTALALVAGRDVARELECGLAFVSAASLRDPALLVPEIARAFGIRDESSGDKPLLETIAEAIEFQDVLLVLDNAETVIDAVREIAGLLELSPRLRILATSRERLRIRGERTLPIAPLPILDPARHHRFELFARNDAVRLFEARARDLDLGFALSETNATTISAICHRLDGLPLAIELIASRMADSTPVDILAGLDRRLDELRDGPRDLPERLQTMRSAIAWSHDSLSTIEQQLFRALSTFDGGAEVEMAIGVTSSAGGEKDGIRGALRRLAEKSLIHPDPYSDPPRIAMLETIREYAQEQRAAAADGDQLRRAHLAAVATMATEAESGLAGPDQIWWLDRIDANIANIRAALTTAIAVQAYDVGQETAGAIWRYWSIRSDRQEGRRWLSQLLAPTAGCDSPERVTALRAAALLAEDQGDRVETRRCLDEALRICQFLELQHRKCQILSDLGNLAHDTGDFASSERLHIEANALAIELGFASMVVVTSTNLAMRAYHRGDLDEAIRRWKEALNHFDTPEQEAILFGCLGAAESGNGNFSAAVSYEERALSVWRRLDSRKGMADSLSGLATAHFGLGIESARIEIEEAISLYQKIGDRRGEANAMRFRAEIALKDGVLASAHTDLRLGVAMSIETDDPISVLEHLDLLIHYRVLAGDFERAITIWSGCETHRKEIDSLRMPTKVALIDQLGVSIREHVDEDRFRSLWESAARLSLQAIVEIAMAE